jgi:triosephosphate isomerase (TIM)
MRKKIVGANWKMNLSRLEAETLYHKISALGEANRHLDLVVFPPQPFLGLLSRSSGVALGAQNVYGPEVFGAYTGETSLQHLMDLHIQHVIIGHSERRMYFNEHSDFIDSKAIAALNAGFQVFFCCGESMEIRENGTATSWVQAQLTSLFEQMDPTMCSALVIAYEPIWAIGTGKVPLLDEITAMHGFIRGLCEQYFESPFSDAIRIIYGGSCTADNAGAMAQLPNVDGFLVGGASLSYSSMEEIIARV